MEFKKKISNVAFGGNWSEELITEYELLQSLTSLQWAIDNCRKREVNTTEVNEALNYLTKDLEKGKMLSDKFKIFSWNRFKPSSCKNRRQVRKT